MKGDRRHLRRKTKLQGFNGFVHFLLAISFLTGEVLAMAPAENTVYVAPTETIRENYFWTGDILDFNGHALKDLILFGKEVNVRGIVEGDVIAFAQRVRISGEVKGSVRAAGETINLEGKVGKNATLAGKYIDIPKSAEIGWDLLSASQRLYVEGKVNGELKGGGGEAILGGEVGGSVDLKTRELSVLPTAYIKGNLLFSAEREAVIPKEARIEGKLLYTPPPAVTPKPLPKGIPSALKFLWLLGLIATGAVMVLLFPCYMREMGDDMLSKPWPNIAWGFLVFLATPISVLLIAFSVIGIPLALISFGLYLVALYLTIPLVGTAIGKRILGWILRREDVNLYGSMVLGITIFFLLQHIPLIGWIIGLLGVCWGFGGIEGAIGKRIKAGRLGPQD